MSDLTKQPARTGAVIGGASAGETLTMDGETVSRFSHQLRSLLTSVGAAAQYLLHNETERCVQDEMLGIISEQATRIDGLLEDFLVIARDTPRGQGSAAEVNLYHVTREVVRELAPEAQSIGTWLVLDAAGAVPPVVGHHQPLRQAITGTLRALMLLTRAGERVVARLEDARDESGLELVELSVIVQSDDPSLRDRAGGMAPTDLALEAARRICESHGGSLKMVEDAPGVICRLPAATMRLTPAAAVSVGSRIDMSGT